MVVDSSTQWSPRTASSNAFRNPSLEYLSSPSQVLAFKTTGSGFDVMGSDKKCLFRVIRNERKHTIWVHSAGDVAMLRPHEDNHCWDAYFDSKKSYSAAKIPNGIGINLSVSLGENTDFGDLKDVRMAFTSWVEKDLIIYEGDPSTTIAKVYPTPSTNEGEFGVLLYHNVDIAFVVTLISIAYGMNVYEYSALLPLNDDGHSVVAEAHNWLFETAMHDAPELNYVPDPVILYSQNAFESGSQNTDPQRTRYTLTFKNFAKGDSVLVINNNEPEKAIFSIGRNGKKFLVQDLCNQTISATLEPPPVSFHGRYDGYMGESRNKIFSAANEHIVRGHTHIIVTLENGRGKYHIQGSWRNKSSTIYSGDSSLAIAKIRPCEIHDGDFSVDVFLDGLDPEFLVRLLAAVYAIKGSTIVDGFAVFKEFGGLLGVGVGVGNYLSPN